MPYLPSPQDIARETAKIRETWTASERRLRRGQVRGKAPGIRVVSTAGLDPNVSEDLGGLTGWQYLQTSEIKQQKRRKKPQPAVTPEENSEREQFQAVPVNFGEEH